MTFETNPTECLVPGDPDVIGLGFRLGFYFQLLSTLLLGIVRPEEAADSFIPNLFFIIGLVCAAIYSSSRLNYPPGAVIACTWYPVLAYVALLPLFYRHLPTKLPWYRVMMYPAVVIATCCFAIWFWYSGLDAVHSAQCMEPRVFLFYNLSAKGPVRIVFRVFTVLSLMIAIISGGGAVLFQSISLSIVSSNDFRTLFPHDLVIESDGSVTETSQPTQIQVTHVTAGENGGQGTTAIPHGGGEGETKQQPHKPAPTAAEISTETQHTTHRFRVPILGSICLVWGILASELQLKWNHIVGINSINTSGQVLPLVLGVFSLLYTLFALKWEFWKALKRLWLQAKQFGRFILSSLKICWNFIVWLFGKVRSTGGGRALSKYMKKPSLYGVHNNC